MSRILGEMGVGRMIRKGRVDDQPLIMEIIQDAVIDMESKGICQWDSIYPDSEIISEDLDNETLYVYEEDGIIKGIIVLNEYQNEEYNDIAWEFNSGKQLVVHRLCVDPKYQGKGIAKLLMNYAEELGKQLGHEAIRLDAFVNNERSCNLYNRLGYKAVGIVEFRKGKFYCFEKKLESK